PYDAAGGSPSAGQPARVTWEYAGPEGWAALAVDGETRAFAERGLISFVGPPDLTPRVELGQERAWLRARWEPGTGGTPLLRRAARHGAAARPRQRPRGALPHRRRRARQPPGRDDRAAQDDGAVRGRRRQRRGGRRRRRAGEPGGAPGAWAAGAPPRRPGRDG